MLDGWRGVGSVARPRRCGVGEASGNVCAQPWHVPVSRPVRRGSSRRLLPIWSTLPRLPLVRLGAFALSFVLLAVPFFEESSPAPRSQWTRQALIMGTRKSETVVVGQTYNLYQSYPNFRRFSDYFLLGTNKYLLLTSPSGADQTSLWFQPLGDGKFKQFATTPYRECHWDLLRWGGGEQGLLVYIATLAACASDHTEIVFHPGIAYMPKTWISGGEWTDKGISHTVYYDNGIAVCDGTNTWQSLVLGLTMMSDGGDAVHTQTNENQTLYPIAGAPTSSACPAGQVTRFGWQENFYLDSPLTVRKVDGAVYGSDIGLVRSTGGNTAATREAHHPQWDSVFSSWEPLPTASVGALTTASTNVASASADNTIAFTYTAPPHPLTDAVVTVTVAPGWTAPVTTNAVGCTVATAGAVTTSGQTITVSDLTLPANGQTVITYGATSSGACAAGDAATASSTPGAPVWQARVQPRAGAELTSLTSSPSIDVDAADGSGTLTTPMTNVLAGSTENTLSFTYTAPTGGISDGAVTITVPSGWTAPVATNASACTVATTGTIGTSGQTIIVSDLSLAANTSVVITYGATSGGNCSADDGVTAPPSSGTSTFTAEEMSTADGTLSTIAVSPTVTIS